MRRIPPRLLAANLTHEGFTLPFKVEMVLLHDAWSAVAQVVIMDAIDDGK